MKIGVLTYHRSHNYGACLQAYALTLWIRESTGFDTELIDFNMKAAEKFYLKEIIRGKSVVRVISNVKRYMMFRQKALKEMPVSDNSLISDNLDEFRKFIDGRYDVIVVGSDEVWKIGFRGFPNPYFLPLVNGCKKLAYGVSARCDFSELGAEKCEQLKSYLKSFEYIGVRDKATRRSVSPFCGNNSVHLNCDPTFNFDFHPKRENGLRILHSEAKLDAGKKTIAFMFIDEGKAQKIIAHYGDKYNYVALYDAIPGIPNMCSITPFQWVDVIASCDFLVTNYFHGMCFAMKSNIPFIVMEIRGGDKADSKSYDLLSECGLEERFFMKEELDDIEPILKIIDRDIGSDIRFDSAVRIQKEKAESFLAILQS